MNLGLLDSESGLHWGRQLALCQPQLHADFEGVAFGTEFFELPDSVLSHSSEILALEVWFGLSGWPSGHVLDVLGRRNE